MKPDSIYAGEGPSQSEIERRETAARQWIPGWSMITDWYRASIDPDADNAEIINRIVAAAAAEGVENLSPALKLGLGAVQSGAEYAGVDDPIQAAVIKHSREDIDTPAGPLTPGPGLNQRMLAKHWRNQREAATLAAAQEEWVGQKEEAYDAALEASDLADDGDVPPEDDYYEEEALAGQLKAPSSIAPTPQNPLDLTAPVYGRPHPADIRALPKRPSEGVPYLGPVKVKRPDLAESTLKHWQKIIKS
jgi:hypothetical protein